MVNTRVQGLTGIGNAIKYFTSLGYAVFIPLGEVQRYDLVIDDRTNPLKRVECKTTTFRKKSGSWSVELRTSGGNKSGTGLVKHISEEQVDVIFILCGDGSQYLFPSTVLSGMGTVTLSSKYDIYKL